MRAFLSTLLALALLCAGIGLAETGGGHEFYGQSFEDAMNHILSYIGRQLADAE